MKKVCAGILIIALVFGLAGCGGTRNGDVSQTSDETNNSRSEPLSGIVDDGMQLQSSESISFESNNDTAMDVVEKVIGKAVDDEKETPEKTERHIHAKDEPSVQPESPPQPNPSVLAGKYPRLKEIDSRLKDQNKAIFGREKKRNLLKEELSECTSIFKGGRRKELQQEINEIDIQISNMKKRLSSIVKEYKFDSVQAFYKEFNAAKREYLDYKTARVGWEKIYGDKVTNPKSIREQLRQKEQMVKEREAGRDYWTRRKDKGAR